MLEFHVSAISCGHCARAITEAVRRVDGEAKVQVDVPARSVRVESGADRKVLADALAEAGYRPD